MRLRIVYDRISWPHHARLDSIHANCPTQLGGVHKLIPQEPQNILHSLLTSVSQTVKRWPAYKHHAGTYSTKEVALTNLP